MVTATRTKNPRRAKAIAPIETAQEAIAPIETTVELTLDDEIDQLYSEAVEAEDTMLNAGKAAAQLYFKLGDRLSQRKSELGHGQWLPYLEQHQIPERTAQRAMQIHRAFLEKSDNLTDLTLTEALEKCRKVRSLPPAEQIEPPASDDIAPAEWKAAIPPLSLENLKALFAQIGTVSDRGNGFSVERPDLGPPFPLAFRNAKEAQSYWEKNSEKLLSWAERKPMPGALGAIATDDGTRTGTVLEESGDSLTVQWQNGQSQTVSLQDAEDYGWERSPSAANFDQEDGSTSLEAVLARPEYPEPPSWAVEAEIFGMAEVHAAVRQFSDLNDRRWTDAQMDAIAAQVLTVLANF